MKKKKKKKEKKAEAAACADDRFLRFLFSDETNDKEFHQHRRGKIALRSLYHDKSSPLLVNSLMKLLRINLSFIIRLVFDN